MPEKYVRILFGPCDQPSVHKPQKLAGTRKRLLQIGYRVDLVPVQWYNYCTFEMAGWSIFRCNVSNFLFNMPWKVDALAQKAVDAVEDASRKIILARTYSWISELLNDAIFKRNSYSVSDHWVSDLPEMPKDVKECTWCNLPLNKLLMQVECTCDIEECISVTAGCQCDLEVEAKAENDEKVCVCDREVCSCHEIGCQCNEEICVCDWKVETEGKKEEKVCVCDTEICSCHQFKI